MGVRQSVISPKFEKGLKEGKYVHKTHYLCPWNTRVLYGEGLWQFGNRLLSQLLHPPCTVS